MFVFVSVCVCVGGGYVYTCQSEVWREESVLVFGFWEGRSR